MSESPPESKPSHQLRKDFHIFLEPGFLAALAVVLLLGAAGAGAILYGTVKYGISPF
jgi:hypothetical protein